jgi:hypothetical protein
MISNLTKPLYPSNRKEFLRFYNCIIGTENKLGAIIAELQRQDARLLLVRIWVGVPGILITVSVI